MSTKKLPYNHQNIIYSMVTPGAKPYNFTQHYATFEKLFIKRCGSLSLIITIIYLF